MIDNLEQGVRTQADLDIAYTGWCDIVKSEMYYKLPHKTIDPNMKCNKKFKHRKPWWNDNLSESWKILHAAEREWLKCNNRSTKTKLKHRYVNLRKQFDKNIQRYKRNYVQKTQDELLSHLENDQNKFWKSIGKTGIVVNRNKQIPMQVVLDDGSICEDVKTVLNKWQNDFCKLLNVDTDVQVEDNIVNNTKNVNLDKDICILEVVKAVEKAKLGKAAGIDCIPSEVLKNDSSIYVLHCIFKMVASATFFLASPWPVSEYHHLIGQFRS